jgi:hypothetical protein
VGFADTDLTAALLVDKIAAETVAAPALDAHRRRPAYLRSRRA